MNEMNELSQIYQDFLYYSACKISITQQRMQCSAEKGTKWTQWTHFLLNSTDAANLGNSYVKNSLVMWPHFSWLHSTRRQRQKEKFISRWLIYRSGKSLWWGNWLRYKFYLHLYIFYQYEIKILKSVENWEDMRNKEIIFWFEEQPGKIYLHETN